jgi:hypothetical protein
MKKLIRVTPQDIREGERKDCHYCPIARAMNRAFRNKNIQVVGPGVWIKGKLLRLPDPAMDFILRFDKGWPVKPFSFLVEV